MNWIAWQKGTAQKPEITQVAKRLGVSRGDAVIACLAVWEWADENSPDGHVDGMTAADLSDAVRIPGIGEALKSCVWLLEDPRGILFPNWERWNGESAKKRLQGARRIERWRRTHRQDGIGSRRARMNGTP